MRVLVACEYSGIVRDAFTARGHFAMSCDILETESDGEHFTGDVREVLDPIWSWDLMIAHPPCTYLANSGVSWLHRDTSRWPKLFDAADFFCELMAADIPMIAVENPIMHKYARRLVGFRQDQVVQPWMFGHGEQKATCLWLKGLPHLRPTDIVEGREQRIWKLPPSKDRWKLRSETFQGIANAMAEQWG